MVEIPGRSQVDTRKRRKCEIRRICRSSKTGEIKVGDLLTEKSELKEKDIDQLDHLVKKELYKRIEVVYEDGGLNPSKE